MKIVDLEPRQGKVDIEVEVVDIKEVKAISRFGVIQRVATARVKDDTGEIDLKLLNDSIDEVSVYDRIKIENGYVSEIQGNPHLTPGKFGTLKILK